MARIYGFQAMAGTCLRDGLRSLRSRLNSAPAWIPQEATAGNGSLGYFGPSPGLARSGNCLAVVDGHFCNTRELPKAAGDADRMIILYERHGFEGALGRIAGDFAVALYDAATDELWLGRDRAGIRPCYYASFQDGVAFASQPQFLLSLPHVSPEVNHEFAALFAASHYRTFDNNPFSSPYRAIRQLPAAHLARVRNGCVELRRWWHLPAEFDFTLSADELAERYRELLLHVVGEHLQVVQRPAFTLSGGMDSSSVLASAVRIAGKRQHAFSAVYEDPTFDETDEIAAMHQAAVAQWHPVRIGQVDLFDLVSKMVSAHGEPVATATWLSHWLLCQEVSAAGFDALLGGLGGDELNAGEYEYFFFHFADLRAGGHEELLTREIDAWSHHHDHPLWRKTRAVAEEGLSRLVDWNAPGRCLPDRRRIARYAHVLQPGCLDVATFEPVMDSPFNSYLKNRTWQDLFRETTPCCLRAEDRQTRAFGLSNLDPFLDHRLIEFMFRVPGAMKIQNGVTKILLRRAMKGLLPEETRTRVKKTGWNAPAHVWFTGAQAEALREMVRSPRFRASHYYDPACVERLIDEHCEIVHSGAMKENHMMFFWQLLNLEAWLEMISGRAQEN